MHTISARRQRYIQPIIDQHARPVWARGSNGLARKVNERARREVSFSNLNQLAAGLRR